MFPTKAEIGQKVSLELLALTVLSIPVFYVHLISGPGYTPFLRGFYCDDQNLKHPYVESQKVPMMFCFAMWNLLLLIFIVFIELLRSRAMKSIEFPIFGVNLPWLVIELYRSFGYLMFGGISSIVFTDLSKFTVGRLRPHFLTICQPSFSDELCKDEFGYPKYVVEDDSKICFGLQSNTTQKMMREARMSFMSGHSSFSFYCATFLVLYLQARLNKFPDTSLHFVNRTVKILKVIRPFLQFSIIVLAFWIALTRISDYFHHPTDVVAGCIVGIVFGILTLIVSNICEHQTAYWKFTNKIIKSKAAGEKMTKQENHLSKKKSLQDFVK